MAASYVLAQSGSKTHTSFVAPPYPPSTASLAALQKLFLKDLRLETVRLFRLKPPLSNSEASTAMKARRRVFTLAN